PAAEEIGFESVGVNDMRSNVFDGSAQCGRISLDRWNRYPQTRTQAQPGSESAAVAMLVCSRIAQPRDRRRVRQHTHINPKCFTAFHQRPATGRDKSQVPLRTSSPDGGHHVEQAKFGASRLGCCADIQNLHQVNLLTSLWRCVVWTAHSIEHGAARAR